MSELQSTLIDNTATHATTPLSANDRCDSCGAQAYVRVTIPSGALLFCGHHATKHKDQLIAQALTWHDETFRLNPASPELDRD
jgi:hypothetical protein